MSFKLTQEDANEFRFAVELDDRTILDVLLSTCEAVELFVAVEDGIGDYVREMRRAKQEYHAATTTDAYDDFGDFNGEPFERYQSHQRAKGRA